MIQCEVCGNSKNLHTKTKNNIYGKILCKKHYNQLRKHGKILNRTIYDVNEILIEDGFAKICLYDKIGNIINYAIIDIEDIDKIKKYKWGIHNKNHYVRNVVNRLYLHKLIMDCLDNDFDVDHINHNPLDNRKHNLRIITHQQNSIYKSIQCNNKSDIIGVFWDKERDKWRAELRYSGKNYHLGRFVNFEDAILSRLKAEQKFFGEFSPQKHLFEKYNI